MSCHRHHTFVLRLCVRVRVFECLRGWGSVCVWESDLALEYAPFLTTFNWTQIFWETLRSLRSLIQPGIVAKLLLLLLCRKREPDWRCRRPRGRWPSNAATLRVWSCSESPCAMSRKRPTYLTTPPTPLWSSEPLGTLPRRRSTRCYGLSFGTTCCPWKPGSWATRGPRSLSRPSGTAVLHGARWAKALLGFGLPIAFRVFVGAAHRHKNDRLISGHRTCPVGLFASHYSWGKVSISKELVIWLLYFH